MLKQEPSIYNFDALEKEKKTVWDGVHNNLALKYMSNTKKGDKAIFYHTGGEKQAVGVVDIISNPYPNPKKSEKRFIVFDIKVSHRLKRPVALEEIKKDPKFKNWELVKNSRLSTMSVPKDLLGYNKKIKQLGFHTSVYSVTCFDDYFLHDVCLGHVNYSTL